MTIKTNIPLDHPAWNTARELFWEAVDQQKPHVRDYLRETLEDSLEAFLDYLAHGPLVIPARFLDDGLNYIVCLRGDQGDLIPIAKIHASRLGLNDDDTQLAELLNGA